MTTITGPPTVKSAAFKGKSRVAQHQMVYAALKGNMGGVLHALQLTTVAKDSTPRHGPLYAGHPCAWKAPCRPWS